MMPEDPVHPAMPPRSRTPRPGPTPEASIETRAGRGTPARVATAVVALALAAGGIVYAWTSIPGGPERATPAVGPSVRVSPSAAPSPAFTADCDGWWADGDFDGDGREDQVSLGASRHRTCGGRARGFRGAHELLVQLRGSRLYWQPFDFCRSFTCRVAGASDFDGDGRSELVVNLGPGAAITYWGVYRVGPSVVEPLAISAPGDRPYLDPGSAIFGGSRDSGAFESFDCVGHGRSRSVMAWQADRTDGGRWDVHTTVLQLRGDVFTVVGRRDERGVEVLPGAGGPGELPRVPRRCP